MKLWSCCCYRSRTGNVTVNVSATTVVF